MADVAGHVSSGFPAAGDEDGMDLLSQGLTAVQAGLRCDSDRVPGSRLASTKSLDAQQLSKRGATRAKKRKLTDEKSTASVSLASLRCPLGNLFGKKTLGLVPSSSVQSPSRVPSSSPGLGIAVPESSQPRTRCIGRRGTYRNHRSPRRAGVARHAGLQTCNSLPSASNGVVNRPLAAIGLRSCATGRRAKHALQTDRHAQDIRRAPRSCDADRDA